MARRKAGTVKSTGLTGITFALDDQGIPTFHGTRFQFTAQVSDFSGRTRPMVSERIADNISEFGQALTVWAKLSEAEAGLMGVKFDAPPEQPEG